MNERDRLIGLIHDSDYSLDSVRLADHLLANGIIVPPCKVGDIVYQLDNIVDYELCYECENYYEGGMGDYPSCEKTHSVFRCTNCIEIVETVASEEFILRYFYDFGKTVFLNHEEAEKVLKERSEKQ